MRELHEFFGFCFLVFFACLLGLLLFLLLLEIGIPMATIREIKHCLVESWIWALLRPRDF